LGRKRKSHGLPSFVSGPWIGRLVVLGDEFNLPRQDAAGLVDAIERNVGSRQGIFAGIGRGPGDGKNHADPDRRALSKRAAQNRRHGHARNETGRHRASG